METNMTRGRPMGIILRFTLPILLGNVFQTLYNMVDTIIVGRFVGQNALAGVGSTGTIMFLVLGFSNGMTTGFSVLTSHKYGAGNMEETKRSVANGILLSIMVALVMTTVSMSFMDKLLHLMNTPDDIYRDAYNYIIIICAGITPTIFYNLFSSFLRAVGNSRTPLYFLIFSSVLNVFLDLFFIVGLGLETRGAALATILSQGIAALGSLTYILLRVEVLTPRRSHWRLNKEDSRFQLLVGLPMALQYGITASGTVIMQSAINVFGSAAVASYTAANKVQSILMQGLLSVGLTMAAYSGQNFGAGDIGRIKQGTRDAMKYVLVYSMLASAFAIFGLQHFLPLFFSGDVDMATVIAYARPYIYECASCYIPLGMIFVYRNTMQGCGYGFEAMSLGFVELAARSAVSFLAIHLYLYPLATGADASAWLSTGIFAYIMYRYVLVKIERKRQEEQEEEEE